MGCGAVAWALFVLLLSTLVCCQPQSWFWVFLFHKFSNPPPPPCNSLPPQGPGGKRGKVKDLQEVERTFEDTLSKSDVKWEGAEVNFIFRFFFFFFFWWGKRGGFFIFSSRGGGGVNQPLTLFGRPRNVLCLYPSSSTSISTPLLPFQRMNYYSKLNIRWTEIIWTDLRNYKRITMLLSLFVSLFNWNKTTITQTHYCIVYSFVSHSMKAFRDVVLGPLLFSTLVWCWFWAFFVTSIFSPLSDAIAVISSPISTHIPLCRASLRFEKDW